MKKIFILYAFFLSLLSFSQKMNNEVFESDNYTISKPDTWKATNDNGIVNIFPTSLIGAVTISEYHELDLPKSEVKKFILSLYKSSDNESKVKSSSSKKGYTEYFYEFFDEKEKLFWITKVFQKNRDLYIISINCQQKHWNGNYMMLFNETFNSFKLKK